MVTPQVIHGNALDLAACGIADDSVDLVVTSPPYFGLRSYQDGGEHYAGQIGAEATPAEFVDALIAATAEMVRVLKPTGSIFVNLGDTYSAKRPYQVTSSRGQRAARGVGVPFDTLASAPRKSLLGIPNRYVIRCIDELWLTWRAEIIWHKPNAMPEPSARDRYVRSHETWFHLTRGPKYYGARQGHEHDVIDVNACGVRLPDGSHHATFPVEWPRTFIERWCPEGGTVLDPFGGTGTTATVAHALGRHGITVDLSHDYCRAAQWRTTDPGQLAKARQAPKPRTVAITTGQGDVEVPVEEPSLLDLIEGDAA